MIEEFLAVRRTKTKGKRVIDGVIVLGEKFGIYEGNYYDIKGKDIVVIQTKHNRLGMYLLGQAYFSKFLMEKFKPKSIKSVAICGAHDDILSEIAKDHGVQIIVIGEDEYDEQYDSPKYIKKNKQVS